MTAKPLTYVMAPRRPSRDSAISKARSRAWIGAVPHPAVLLALADSAGFVHEATIVDRERISVSTVRPAAIRRRNAAMDVWLPQSRTRSRTRDLGLIVVSAKRFACKEGPVPRLVPRDPSRGVPSLSARNQPVPCEPPLEGSLAVLWLVESVPSLLYPVSWCPLALRPKLGRQKGSVP
jgi:hypothetical protein